MPARSARAVDAPSGTGNGTVRTGSFVPFVCPSPSPGHGDVGQAGEPTCPTSHEPRLPADVLSPPRRCRQNFTLEHSFDGLMRSARKTAQRRPAVLVTATGPKQKIRPQSMLQRKVLPATPSQPRAGQVRLVSLSHFDGTNGPVLPVPPISVVPWSISRASNHGATRASDQAYQPQRRNLRRRRR